MELCGIQESDRAYIRGLFEEAFPPCEWPYLDKSMEKAKRGLADFWVIREDGRNIGLACLTTDEEFAYLLYFAVDSSCRGRGFGSAALKAIMEKYGDRHLALCAEDWEEKAENAEQRVRRYRFYRRHGLIDLPFKVKEDGMSYIVMSSTGAVGPESYAALAEGTMGLPIDNFEIVPR